MNEGDVGVSGQLGTRLIKAPRPHTARGFRLPGVGRVMFTRDPGDAGIFAREVFASELVAVPTCGTDLPLVSHRREPGPIPEAPVTARRSSLSSTSASVGWCFWSAGSA